MPRKTPIPPSCRGTVKRKRKQANLSGGKAQQALGAWAARHKPMQFDLNQFRFQPRGADAQICPPENCDGMRQAAFNDGVAAAQKDIDHLVALIATIHKDNPEARATIQRNPALKRILAGRKIFS